ncbi:MAG: APC family permease [Candidatus Aenigmarchaeota archaeon]|nr:APC family permease [Candidatus Aenigmarchaeota archaeon]
MKKLLRKFPLVAVIAAALCNVIGGGINVLIVDIQNSAIGIGNWIPLAVVLGGLIAVFISLVYSSLATAMPRAGGGYIYISRGLSPFWGFIGSFLKWASSVIALGSVSYMDATLLVTALHYLGLHSLEAFFATQIGMVVSSLSIIWFFWLIHYFGVRKYAYTVILLAFLMFLGGGLMILIGFTHTPTNFLNVTKATLPHVKENHSILNLMYAVAILFWAYIGFTSISQSGGEIENPKRNLPRAFIISSLLIMIYYFIYSTAVYHAVPWQYMVGMKDINVPALLGVFLPPGFATIITLFVFLTLANDVPPMLYAKSRLFYGWARDGIIPRIFEKTNKYKVPSMAMGAVALTASAIAVSCVFGGFFTEVDVVVISRFLVYILISLSLINLKNKNKKIYKQIKFLKNRTIQITASIISLVFSFLLLGVLLYMDLTSGAVWYEMSSVQSAIIIAIGAAMYYSFVWRMKKAGKDYNKVFESLPSE